MVENEHDEETGERTIVLRPNSSLNKREAIVLLSTMAVIMGIIGGLFTALGAWLVLPFSGLEWLLVVYCFHLSFRSSTVLEVIRITDAEVKVEKGRKRPEQTYQFRRAWVMLNWIKSPVRGRPSRLSLRVHGTEVEVGRFLVESERQALAHELKAMLGSR